MTTLAPLVQAVVKPGTLQRKCGCSDPGKCSCHEPEKEKAAEKGTVQRRARAGAAGPAAASKNSIGPSLTRGIQQSAGGGQSLPAAVQRQMEAGFGGRDLSNVRVHTDAKAAQLADSLHAEAFTTGSNIFFARDRYRPDSPEGRRLLAHELTHVVQQGNEAPGAIQPRLELGAVYTAAEREADRAADALASGLRASPVVASPRTAVQRTSRKPKTPDPDSQAIVLPKSEPLKLPAQKADSDSDLKYLLELYRNAAKNKRLRTTHAGRASGLWGMWEAGRQNVKGIEKRKTRLRSICSPDHIQELQVNGNDNANNLRLLSQPRNERAGSQIAGQIRSLENSYGVSASQWLQFTAVEPLNKGEAVTDECLSDVKNEPLKRPGGAVAIDDDSLEELTFVAGGARLRIGYNEDGTIPSKHQYAVPGAPMQKVEEQGDGSHIIRARISPRIKKFPLPANAKIDFETNGPQKADKWPLLKLVNPGPFSLIFPKMSPATVTPSIEEGEWRATGTLRPTLPVLSKSVLFLRVAGEQLSGGLKLDPSVLQAALPVPGLKIGPVTLEIGIDDGNFSATGGFDFRYGNLAHGNVMAGFSDDVFHAEGKIELLIPGIEKAEGKVWIAKGDMGAALTVSAGQLKFPGVKSGQLSVKVASGVLDGTGTVELAIPGLKNTHLNFHADSTGQFGLDGTIAGGDIPGLKDFQGTIGYTPHGLAGRVQAGLKVPGLENASIKLIYANGLLFGGGARSYTSKNGRLSGTVNTAISPAHKLSGRGQLSYEIVPARAGGKGLTALAGIELREDGSTKIDAALRLPDPFVIFDEIGVNKDFGIPQPPTIPIFGISAGPVDVGLVAKINVGLNAHASIGAGLIKGGIVLASFDPEKGDDALSFKALGTVYVPARAGLTLSIGGELSLDLLVVSASGRIDVSATADLLGELTVPIVLQYQGGRFSIDAMGIVTVRPHFVFAGTASVKIYTDLLIKTITYYKHTWPLFNATWDPDFKMIMLFPVHYAFGEPFSLNRDQITFIHPDFSFRSILHAILPDTGGDD